MSAAVSQITRVTSVYSYILTYCPDDAYMRLWTSQALVSITVCRMFGAKPLFKSNILVNWTDLNEIAKICQPTKMSCVKWRLFRFRLNALTNDRYVNKRLSKQWWGWWFETPSHPLWLHCNDTALLRVGFYPVIYKCLCDIFVHITQNWFSSLTGANKAIPKLMDKNILY